MIMLEECDKQLGVQIGPCLEILVDQDLPAVVLGLVKGNQPEGVLAVGLKFVTILMCQVKSLEILNFRQTHLAIYQVITFIYSSLKNEMILEMTIEDREALLDFLEILTDRVVRSELALADLLLAN